MPPRSIYPVLTVHVMLPDFPNGFCDRDTDGRRNPEPNTLIFKARSPPLPEAYLSPQTSTLNRPKSQTLIPVNRNPDGRDPFTTPAVQSPSHLPPSSRDSNLVCGAGSRRVEACGGQGAVRRRSERASHGRQRNQTFRPPGQRATASETAISGEREPHHIGCTLCSDVAESSW
eukprot:2447169-Rhodomonas_salina.1